MDPLELIKTRRSIRRFQSKDVPDEALKQVLEAIRHDRVKGVLGLPDEYEVVAIVPLGYPAQPSNAPRRREIHEFCHEERFS